MTAHAVLLVSCLAAICQGSDTTPSTRPAASRAAAADLVLLGGKVFTAAETRPGATGVAIRNGAIVAVGTDAEVAAAGGPEARVVRLAGRAVVPGFIDSHVHFVTGGFELLGPDLHGTKSEAEFAQRLAAAAGRMPKGAWITGGGWDHEAWPGHQLPRRSAVDPLTPDHPVFVLRTDGHLAFANGAALAIAGVTRETPDPAGGVIERDAGGEPSGCLKDAAQDLVQRVIPDPSFESRLAAARAAMAQARRKGVTCVHDMGAAGDLPVWRRLAQDGELTVRVRFFLPLAARAALPPAAERGDDLLRVCGVKGFADGSLGASTALMFSPFADDGRNSGLRDPAFQHKSDFLTAVAAVDAQGLQVCIHAIGDRANAEVLDLFERLAREAGARDRRARIEHAQHLRPVDIPRFAALGVLASVQPYHCIDDGRWAERKLGPERCRTTYAFRSLLDAGARVAFGSDWFVAPLDPMAAIQAAVTRATLDGRHPGGWVPEEKVSVAEAITCHTAGGAFAAFDEQRLGRIAPGLLADLVVLDQDPLAVEPARLAGIDVVATLVGGRVVHGELPH